MTRLPLDLLRSCLSRERLGSCLSRERLRSCLSRERRVYLSLSASSAAACDYASPEIWSSTQSQRRSSPLQLDFGVLRQCSKMVEIRKAQEGPFSSNIFPPPDFPLLFFPRKTGKAGKTGNIFGTLLRIPILGKTIWKKRSMKIHKIARRKIWKF